MHCCPLLPVSPLSLSLSLFFFSLSLSLFFSLSLSLSLSISFSPPLSFALYLPLSLLFFFPRLIFTLVMLNNSNTLFRCSGCCLFICNLMSLVYSRIRYISPELRASLPQCMSTQASCGDSCSLAYQTLLLREGGANWPRIIVSKDVLQHYYGLLNHLYPPVFLESSGTISIQKHWQ